MPAWPTPAPHVAAEALNVAPDLLGRPLATPARRAAAMTLDLTAIGLLSTAANVWLLAAAALAGWMRWRARPPAPRWLWFAVGSLVALGAVDAWRERVPRLRDADELAEIEGAASAAAAALKAASGVSWSASGVERLAGDAALEALSNRVEALQAENQRLRGAAPLDWRQRLAGWLDDIGLGYGGALLYFTLLPAALGGRTPGKALLKLRVVELTGRPVTPLLALKRFGGYAAGLATGGVGLAQVLWDRQAQGLQDKAAHTVVIDERDGRG